MSGLILADSLEPVAQISGGLAEPLTFVVGDELLLLLRAVFEERDGHGSGANSAQTQDGPEY